MPKIALVQMVSSFEVETNLLRAEALIRQAAQEQVQAIFLPENFAALGNPSPRLVGEAEVNGDGPIRRFIHWIAEETGCWIFAGTLPLAVRPDGRGIEDGRVRAASIVVDDLGQEVARYDKIHMFDVLVEDNHKRYVESATFECGEQLQTVETPFGLFGLTVCYDIRFPEVYRALRNKGVRNLCIPSAFTTTTGKAHFEILMRARAIENLCFTIAACQGGDHDSGRKTFGHSMVVDPWGEVIARAGTGEDIIFAELNYEMQDQIRRDMPVHKQKKL
jgi:nitrilase